MALGPLLVGLGLSGLTAALLSEGAMPVVLLPAAGALLLAATVMSRYAALALLGLLLVGHVGFSIDFAKTSITLFGLPLYVTDFLLAPVLIASLLSGRWRRPEATPLVLAVGAFCGFSLLSALFSLIDERELQLVLYQGTPFIYYPLAALCLAWNIDLRKDRSLVVACAAAACSLAVGYGVFHAITGQFFATEQDVPRYLRGDSGTFLAASFVALLLLPPRPLRTEIRMLAPAAALVAGALLSEHRSVWLAAAIALSVSWLVAPRARPAVRASVWLAALVLSLAVGGLLLESDQVSGTLDRILSTADTTTVNADYRLAAWDASLADIGENPLGGSGFGKMFVFYNRGLLYTGAPHNSLVNIAWYLGIPGFLLFVLTQAVFLSRIFRGKRTLETVGWTHVVLFGAWLSLLVVAAFNVILESPVGAIPFWLTIGIPFGAMSSEREAIPSTAVNLRGSERLLTR
ncbi:MAG: O-antigen ligase family protein [Chloroflexota bacterium]|nr:O-antigen ligase family protein [Chloroflexota bacterium]